MVYGLNVKPEHGYYVDFEPLNGDIKKVTLLDETPDEGINPRGSPFAAGRPIDPTHMPTKVQWRDRQGHPIPDFDNGPQLHISERAKALVESFEPGIHQFLPVEFVDVDGNLIENRWFLIVCNRLDSIDRAHVRGFLLWRGKMWTPIQDFVRDMPDEIPPGYDISQKSELVFSRKKIGKAHFWNDKHLGGGGIYISDEIAAALKSGGFTGLRLSANGLETV